MAAHESVAAGAAVAQPARSARAPAVMSALARAGWRLRELASAYLPLLLMAMLALATWWLVSNTPLPPDPGGRPPLRHEPDYTMTQFSLQRFAKDGPLRVQIDGRTLRHFPDNDSFEIDDVHIRSIGPDGRETTATARRAISNADGTDVQLLGGAEVRSDSGADLPPVEMKSEYLQAFLATERVRTHLPVWVRRGATEVHADGLEYDNVTQVVQFKGKVRATIEPQDLSNAPAARKTP